MEVSFNLNGEKVKCKINPTISLLELLREEMGLTGTKPGCNEGECGACTVLIDGISVNACLYPAINIHGKELVTIEGLVTAEGKLDEVQQAMVKHGAVQCGFCTSGMVMNIKAMQRNLEHAHHVPGENIRVQPDRKNIMKWLEGNLCRCTGYVKIIDAAEEVLNKNKI
ncbi:MAG: (2Fe-2S)-binding protein [Candidatus Competibacteraceae bacterium]|nr:(2Fe-2S)-binding protein [Candidatus Competibacteraceae bacterium]